MWKQRSFARFHDYFRQRSFPTSAEEIKRNQKIQKHQAETSKQQSVTKQTIANNFSINSNNQQHQSHSPWTSSFQHQRCVGTLVHMVVGKTHFDQQPSQFTLDIVGMVLHDVLLHAIYKKPNELQWLACSNWNDQVQKKEIKQKPRQCAHLLDDLSEVESTNEFKKPVRVRPTSLLGL